MNVYELQDTKGSNKVKENHVFLLSTTSTCSQRFEKYIARLWTVISTTST